MKSKALEKYIKDVSSPEDELLKELERETHLRVVQPRMLSGHIQGKILELLTKMIKPKNILEIGTFTGYSTLCFAAGLEEDGRIDTVEIDDELESFSAGYFARSQHARKINCYIGSALEIVPKLKKKYDLIFLDGDKREYPEYYKMIMGDIEGVDAMVVSGSVILADNVLWYGKIVEEVAKNDVYTQKILEFNQLVRSDNRVESVLIPVRDGINMIRVL